MIKTLVAAVAAMMIAWPSLARANSADVMMLPTRLVLEKGIHFGTVIVKNTGDAAGDYTVNLTDMKMLDNGAVVQYAKGETPQYSALPFLHAAPGSMTLKPGEAQELHVIMHASGMPDPGEYRAHLQVHLVHANAGQAPADQGRGILVRAEVVMSIPVIVRVGNGAAAMSVEEPHLVKDARGAPQLDFYLARGGDFSAMGDILVSCAQNGGAPRLIRKLPGQAIYRPLARRHFVVPLDETPAGMSLSACRLKIAYVAQKNAGGKILAQADVGP